MIDTLIGKTLGDRYEILEKIGSGGMALVYKARCTLLNRYVAVKVLRDEFTDNEEFIARFNIEAQAAASLSHQNIVSIYDVGTENSLHYIVMECVPGITLKDYINEKGALPWETALDYAIQIASGIEQAHKQNIIHRDIKPHNIIITEEGVLKVTDFGIARALSGNTITVDDSMGSVHYFSPEQARGGYTDEKSDIYSLGVVMYEMLTGHVPFEADSPVSVALMHIQEEPLPILVRNPEVPADLAEIVMKAMAKEQISRFESATALIEALKSFEGVAVPGRTGDTTVIAESHTRERRRNRSGQTKEEKKTITKGDKIAVLAGIAVSFLLVGLMMLLVFKPLFGSEKVQLTVPSLVGKDIVEVQEYYKDSDVFEIVVIRQVSDSNADENEIISQEPKGEQKVSVVEGDRQRIELIVSSGVERLLTPKVVGTEVRQAEILLINAKLVPTIIEEASDEPAGTVIRQYPLEGRGIKTGEEVVLYVSSGPEEKEKVSVPDVVGKTVNEAKTALKDFIKVSVVYEFSNQPENRVVKQTPDAGTEGTEDTEVVLTVSKGRAPVDNPSAPTVGPNPADNPNGNTDTPGVTGKSKNVVIKLPSNLSEVAVLVKANGQPVYHQTVATSLGRITVPVTGTGTVTVEIFFNSEPVGTQTVSFDE